MGPIYNNKKQYHQKYLAVNETSILSSRNAHAAVDAKIFLCKKMHLKFL